ncbi:UNVERIFIED_CONTAM: hypothetical protein FKN15_045013 [Acipenser sinensis]
MDELLNSPPSRRRNGRLKTPELKEKEEKKVTPAEEEDLESLDLKGLSRVMDELLNSPPSHRRNGSLKTPELKEKEEKKVTPAEEEDAVSLDFDLNIDDLLNSPPPHRRNGSFKTPELKEEKKVTPAEEEDLESLDLKGLSRVMDELLNSPPSRRRNGSLKTPELKEKEEKKLVTSALEILGVKEEAGLVVGSEDAPTGPSLPLRMSCPFSPHRSYSPHSSGQLKVQRTSSDPTIEPSSSSTPRNSRAGVSERPASGGQWPALQVSARAHWTPGRLERCHSVPGDGAAVLVMPLQIVRFE